MRTVIYWKTKDREQRKKMMKELDVSGMTVNGESVYNGDVERLREYQEEGLIAIRIKE